MAEPTRDELKAEIENGPLSAELAPFWADVFQPHPKPEMAWQTGILKPDAAFAIHAILTCRARTPYTGRSRADELGWGINWSYELVVAAKGKTPKEAMPPPPPRVIPRPNPDVPLPYPHEPAITFPAEMPIEVRRLHRIRHELVSQTDRGAAMLGAAYLDEALEEIFRAKLVDKTIKEGNTLLGRMLNPRGGVLGGFSARIDTALAMSLIGTHTHDDLHIIRDIRNDFAHDLEVGPLDQPLRFESASVAARCDRLWLPKEDHYAAHSKHTQEQAHLYHPRGQFIFAVYTIRHLLQTATWPAAPLRLI